MGGRGPLSSATFPLEGQGPQIYKSGQKRVLYSPFMIPENKLIPFVQYLQGRLERKLHSRKYKTSRRESIWKEGFTEKNFISWQHFKNMLTHPKRNNNFFRMGATAHWMGRQYLWIVTRRRRDMFRPYKSTRQYQTCIYIFRRFYFSVKHPLSRLADIKIRNVKQTFIA